MTEYGALLTVAHEAVDLARDMMRTLRPGVLTGKGDRDMASEVDFAIERTLRAFLAERTPQVGFLGEEEGTSGAGEELTWSLDPVDGTVNFVHGSPLCAVSLGLIARQRSVLGVIDLPFLGNRYSAALGQGAFCDGERIHASRTGDLGEALVALGDFAVGEDATGRNAHRLAITAAFAERAQRVRMFGSAAIDLAWLAHGRLDAFVMLSNKPWDTSAGVIIAAEAGARLADLDGSPHTADSGATIGASEALLPAVLALVREAAVAARPAE
ncbi:myo-inositol-1(or 4)-monophosphatase [Micromonospora pisi]|uniref:Inositol-1-monophosphatase n=1 Tax=Micromonospora pisi TaxID=589240 RepID=A0A495JJ32_9ACTN|nr:inositol monophosphatase family protein [Micromonospora pisi]RKR88821.1 myo-inositol-1(or 4)-monophosphatase [Micromonospora pisi]